MKQTCVYCERLHQNYFLIFHASQLKTLFNSSLVSYLVNGFWEMDFCLSLFNILRFPLLSYLKMVIFIMVFFYSTFGENFEKEFVHLFHFCVVTLFIRQGNFIVTIIHDFIQFLQRGLSSFSNSKYVHRCKSRQPHSS